MLLAPQIPLLFMGEEDGSTQPFQFFTDYRGELADAVREGRRREFAAFSAFADPAHRDAIPDPNDVATFVRSSPAHADDDAWPDADAWRHFYRSALTVRAALVTPHLPGARALGVELLAGHVSPDPEALVARWRLGDGSTLTIAFNPGSHDAVLPALPVGKIVFETPPRARDRLADQRLPPRTCIAWRDGAVNHDALKHRANGHTRP
jgi:maltooligosyltrehalose trehalohydrolase